MKKIYLILFVTVLLFQTRTYAYDYLVDTTASDYYVEKICFAQDLNENVDFIIKVKKCNSTDAAAHVEVKENIWGSYVNVNRILSIAIAAKNNRSVVSIKTDGDSDLLYMVLK